MKKNTQSVIIFLLVLSLTTPSFTSANDDFSLKKPNFNKKENRKKNYIENQVIVKYKKEKINLKEPAGRINTQKFEEKNSLKISDKIDDLNIALIKSEKTTAELIKELENDPDVEPNYKRHSTLSVNDTYFDYQWYLNNTGQEDIFGLSGTNDADVDAIEAWETELSLTNSNIVAVIDSGVLYDHLDLDGNMWDGSVSCRDEDNIAIVGGCPNHGWDYENNDNDPYEEYDAENDGSGHGTFVSGIVAAETDNNTGISGLSYNNKTKIMALRFGFNTFSEIDAINFAKNNGAKIINASFIGENYSQFEKDAIDSFDGVFVAAAGNGGSDDVGDNIDIAPGYPASYTSSNIITVAATDQNDALTPFSNYGSTSVDIAAPGKNLTSTYNSTTYPYMIASGTSGAAPIVAGITAVLWQKDPTLSVSEIKNLILNTSDQKSSLVDKIKSSGRINFNKALSAINGIYYTSNPIASLASGTFFSNKSITLSSATSGATIYYTTNDSTPTISSTLYSEPITISSNTTLKAIAMKDGMENSDVMTEVYTTTTNTPIYRLYNTRTGVHLYTKGESGRDAILDKWSDFQYTDSSPTFYASTTSQSGLTPIYRLYNTRTGAHLYTKGESGRDAILNKWSDFQYTDSSPTFYASTTSQAGLTPIYRLYNTRTGVHLYTKGESGRDAILDKWSDFQYTDSGPTFYAEIL